MKTKIKYNDIFKHRSYSLKYLTEQREYKYLVLQ